MGTHLIVLGEIFPMNTNMTGFEWLSLRPGALEERIASALEGLTFLLLVAS